MAEDRHPTLRALGLPDVRDFLTARFFGGTARTLLATAISWHLWDLTGREIYLGVLGIVTARVPALGDYRVPEASASML